MENDRIKGQSSKVKSQKYKLKIKSFEFCVVVLTFDF